MYKLKQIAKRHKNFSFNSSIVASESKKVFYPSIICFCDFEQFLKTKFFMCGVLWYVFNK
jgi:hypothetical protein